MLESKLKIIIVYEKNRSKIDVLEKLKEKDMTINKNQNEQTVTLALVGRLDTTTAPDLEKEIDALDNVKELIFDLKELEYTSSAGLRAILKAQKMMNEKGAMKVVNVNDTIMEVFEITGFTDMLTIE